MQRSAFRSGVVARRREQRYQLKNWVDRLQGFPAFIVATGPSVINLDLSVIEPYFSIGINRCYLPPCGIIPTLLFWQDSSFFCTEFHKLQNISSIKVCSAGSADPKRMFFNFIHKSGGYRFEKKTHLLYGHGSSAPLATSFAYALGCSPIVLIGTDCKYAEDGKTDFYGTNKYHTINTLQYCVNGLNAIKELCPVKIYNCGNTDVWEKQDLKEVIEQIDFDKKFCLSRQEYVNLLLRT